MDTNKQTRLLFERMYRSMPALAGMGVQCLCLDSDSVRLSAPLERNQNDKQTAFGGSLTTLGMLSGWMLTQRVAYEEDPGAQCAIFDLQTRFRQPVRDQLIASATCSASDRSAMLSALHSTGKARWTLDITVGSSELADAVRVTASYAIWRSDDDA